MTDERQVRYAVVGAGHIAQVAVLPAFVHAKANSRLVAVVSGDPDKRAALSEHYGLELTGDYDDFATVLDKGAIDAVYIATPNAIHKELALEAAARGVHVLCEKPLAMRAAECRELAATCKSAGVKLMVAYRLHFDAATLHAVEVARSGELGALRLFSSFFSHVVRPDDVRREPSLGGGATYDLGVYCVNAARHLFGAEPSSVYAASIERLGTDDSTTVILQFPGGCLAQFCVANSTAHVSSYRIAGTEGDLRVEPGFDSTRDRVHHLTVGGRTHRTVFRKSDQFAPELLHFSDCILRDLEPEPSAEEAYCDVRVLEAIVESASTHCTVALAPYPYAGHLERSLAASLPPVSRPRTIHAPSPSVR
ncbi:MAG TPA: Gfo/Idh/MocA family oxidoreductase [Polyangiaceae bacterium]|nr:Gfo/Idh/MocA family oxidoreductase [Polyangiaceae bacterium]